MTPVGACLMTPVGASYDGEAQLSSESLLLQSQRCPRGCPSPALSLGKRRLFPAYIWWHQLSALGTTGMSSELWRRELTAH